MTIFLIVVAIMAIIYVVYKVTKKEDYPLANPNGGSNKDSTNEDIEVND